VAALAMAVFLNSMTFEEASRLTQAMAASGTMLDWRADELGGPVVDKHSTGGVGDKVSFLLAPVAAACGCYVPMISGRDLGHGGGTLDKIEAIPGYNAVPGLEQFRKVVASVGCAIIGQTRELAPADRRLYAIRDVTATVGRRPSTGRRSRSLPERHLESKRRQGAGTRSRTSAAKRRIWVCCSPRSPMKSMMTSRTPAATSRPMRPATSSGGP